MEEKRTPQQNRALHLYFELVAKGLNDAGLDMRAVIKDDIEIPWNKDMVKKFLWGPIQEAKLGKKSTTKLTTKEIDIVFNILNRHFGEKLGFHQPFPSDEEVALSKLHINYLR